MPQLKWKAGERWSLASLPERRREFVIPAFTIPPAGSFDIEAKKVETVTEYICGFGKKLFEAWGKRLVFIDASLIDDDRHCEGFHVHPLTELINRAALFGARAAPIFSLNSTPAYMAAVSRFVKQNEISIVCLKVSLFDLETIETSSALEQIVENIGSVSANSILLIDASSLAQIDSSDLQDIASYHLARLVDEKKWAKVFWGATSFPDQLKLKAGETGVFPRSDWRLYREMQDTLLNHGLELGFSDYALEFPGQYGPSKGRTVAHLRYSDENNYYVFKGPRVADESYKAIFGVAQRLVKSDIFKGEDFSLGDAYIAELAKASGRTGGASNWRWCATDHHFKMILDELVGSDRLAAVPEEDAQLALFPV
ncbi:hypothetical protein GV829_07570 [Sphingomonas lacunae]|uniref:T4 beta protein n=1 Tax=Sphingomonas lacunae TaxID=2698828 RepID=A0A6M4AUB6_9SPHN|nr:hypothetical protein [Sphingomonas lacunae]QJQ32326.1 hypothetical protein GV829_07570 [Sphingomonas lacunae]